MAPIRDFEICNKNIKISFIIVIKMIKGITAPIRPVSANNCKKVLWGCVAQPYWIKYFGSWHNILNVFGPDPKKGWL